MPRVIILVIQILILYFESFFHIILKSFNDIIFFFAGYIMRFLRYQDVQVFVFSIQFAIKFHSQSHKIEGIQSNRRNFIGSKEKCTCVN
jgi:hypothetical protein